MPTTTSHSLNTPSVPIGLLSNSRYTTLLTGAGTSYSAWENHALTRWSDDGTEDGDGFFIYLRDLTSGRLWSVGRQPVQTAPDRSPSSYSSVG